MRSSTIEAKDSFACAVAKEKESLMAEIVNYKQLLWAKTIALEEMKLNFWAFAGQVSRTKKSDAWGNCVDEANKILKELDVK